MNASPRTLCRLQHLAPLAGLICALALPVKAETDGTIRKTFDAAPGGNLVVDVAGSRISVEGTLGSKVEIEYTRIVTASSKEEEEQVLRIHAVTIDQAGDTVTIRSEQLRLSSNTSFWDVLFGKRGMQSQFRVTVRIPERFNVDLKTSGGGIELVKLTGRVRARTSGGSLTFKDITGDINGSTSGGGIKLNQFKGDVELSTSGGSIAVAEGAGRLKLGTSGGGITVDRHSGDVQARTSGGGIRVEMAARPAGESSFTTSGGGITVTVPANAALNIDAATSGGGVSTELPVAVTGRVERNRLAGTVNGGGAKLYLRTSGGGIRINRGPDA